MRIIKQRSCQLSDNRRSIGVIWLRETLSNNQHIYIYIYNNQYIYMYMFMYMYLLYRQTRYMSYCAIWLVPLLVRYHFISYISSEKTPKWLNVLLKWMSKKSGSCLTTQHQEYRVCLYNKTIIPFALVVHELIYYSSSWWIVKYHTW